MNNKRCQPYHRKWIVLGLLLSLFILGSCAETGMAAESRASAIIPAPQANAPAASAEPKAEQTPERAQAPLQSAETASLQPAESVPPVPDLAQPQLSESAPPRQPRGRQDVKAVFLTSWTAGNNLDAFLNLLDTTELNAVVIDIREGDGRVAYPTEVAVFRDNKGYRRDYDPREILDRLHERDIWVIGRIVCFKDAFMPRLFPELAIQKKNGSPLVLQEPNGSKGYWMNPAEKATWEPLAALTAEAVSLGFDEIQYDYVRFPETTLFSYSLGDAENTPRNVHIEGFLEYARNSVPDAILSVDIFGVPCLFTEDIGDIGQVLESIGTHIDVISPMVYPSHYCRYDTGGLYGNIQSLFDEHPLTIKGDHIRKPDMAPYEIVYNSLAIARNRLDAVGMQHVTLRPYLQGFTMTAIRADSRLVYDAKAYQKQIRATTAAGGNGWIFWNAGNVYASDAFRRSP